MNIDESEEQVLSAIWATSAAVCSRSTECAVHDHTKSPDLFGGTIARLYTGQVVFGRFPRLV